MYTPVREVSTPFYAHLALNTLNALVHLQFNFRKKNRVRVRKVYNQKMDFW